MTARLLMGCLFMVTPRLVAGEGLDNPQNGRIKGWTQITLWAAHCGLGRAHDALPFGRHRGLFPHRALRGYCSRRRVLMRATTIQYLSPVLVPKSRGVG